MRTHAAEPTRCIDPAAVCTLPAEGLSDRLGWIRREVLPHALSSERQEDGIAWELRDVPGLAAALDQLVVLERECCSGIVLAHEANGAGRRRLTVAGVDPDAAVLASLTSSAAQDPGPGLGRRLAAAAGLGTALSLLVCCVLPVAVAGLFGAGAAASIAWLDEPWIIAATALVSGGAADAWQRRRVAQAAAAEGCGPGC